MFKNFDASGKFERSLKQREHAFLYRNATSPNHKNALIFTSGTIQPHQTINIIATKIISAPGLSNL